jgi:hypothetical protein
MNRSFFPQLSTGAMSQYPLHRRQAFRTVINILSHGREVMSNDSFGSTLTLTFHFDGLSDTEMLAIESYFKEKEGKLVSFGLLDPGLNLLQWSEEFGRNAWEAGPQLAMTTGRDDPWGTQRATSISNASIATQEIVQVLTAPGHYCYSMSVWLRSDVPNSVTLFATSGGYTQNLLVAPQQTWQRYHLPVKLPSDSTSIGFGLEIPAGTTVCAVGAQVDAQPAPCTYRRSTSRHGIHPNVRFAMDSLIRRTNGPNDHSTTVLLTTHSL